MDYVHIGSQINGIFVAHNTYLQILRNGAFYSVHYLSYLCFIYCLNYLDLTFLEKCNSNCCNVDDADLLLTVSFNNSRYVAFILELSSLLFNEKMERDRNEE